MKQRLSRLLNPRSIAVVGGGPWCGEVIRQARACGFGGPIRSVHPRAERVAGLPTYARIADLPEAPDVAFLGINRHATLAAVADLAQRGAGGAVCFASGFSEAAAEDEGGPDLQARLVTAAGDMPVLGPNCYGFVNALDRVTIWPDHHGMRPVERGVAILTQSSNIAINLTMQRRGLPIAMMVTCGNMAQTSQAAIASALLDDDRITAIGLHVEGFGDLREWEALAAKASARGVALVALKVGRSGKARQAAVSHTASLAGSDAGAQALLERLGIARLHDLPGFLETLKLLHCTGPLASNRMASISCSGGEASLIADLAESRDLVFPPLADDQRIRLREALGPMVALANPLDYHTYIWRDGDAMARAWQGMTGAGLAMTMSIVDYPPTDAQDWECATQAALSVHARTGAPFAIVASLPELMPEDIAERLMRGGVVPICGMQEALAALEAAARVRAPDPVPLLLPGTSVADEVMSESEAKAALAAFGLDVPESRVAGNAAHAGRLARDLSGPLALKGLGLAHKSEQGAVKLGLGADQVEAAARGIGTDRFLVEEMVADGVAELLIGVMRDPAHGFVLTLAAGGVLTELLDDSQSLLVPAPAERVSEALERLRCYPLLTGFRGRSGADIDAILRAVEAVQAFVVANARDLDEVEINPLICTPDRAVAVDALIRKARK